MYFAVVKLTFEDGLAGADDRKVLRALIEKIRARFKVCAAAVGSEANGDNSAIAIAALASSSERLTHTLDAIAEYCESAGYGRIQSEQTLMDHIDALSDFAEASE